MRGLSLFNLFVPHYVSFYNTTPVTFSDVPHSSASANPKEAAMRLYPTLSVVGTISLFALPAVAATETKFSVRELPEAGKVMVVGTVQMVKDERNFVLKDTSGTVDVEISFEDGPVLIRGDKVIVTGTMDTDSRGKEIDATSIAMNQ
jgi:uncharacterized protein YdeI (BOF family)